MLLHLSYTPLKKILRSSHVKFFDSNMLSKPHWCRTSLTCKYFNVLNNVFVAQKKNTFIYASSCVLALFPWTGGQVFELKRWTEKSHKELVNFTYLLFLDKLKIWDRVQHLKYLKCVHVVHRYIYRIFSLFVCYNSVHK